MFTKKDLKDEMRDRMIVDLAAESQGDNHSVAKILVIR